MVRVLGGPLRLGESQVFTRHRRTDPITEQRGLDEAVFLLLRVRRSS